MNHALAEAPIADVPAEPARRARLVKGAAAKPAERAAKPTLDQPEHRSHNLTRRRWARALSYLSLYAINPKSRSR
jgi:hypothetical protein